MWFRESGGSHRTCVFINTPSEGHPGCLHVTRTNDSPATLARACVSHLLFLPICVDSIGFCAASCGLPAAELSVTGSLRGFSDSVVLLVLVMSGRQSWYSTIKFCVFCPVIWIRPRTGKKWKVTRFLWLFFFSSCCLSSIIEANIHQNAYKLFRRRRDIQRTQVSWANTRIYIWK